MHEASINKYDLKELENVIQKHKGKIMMVVAYAGDSRTMTIENLEDVAKIVKKHDSTIWLHADACNGFCLAFSDTLKKKIYGIELYDSITMDPHKMLEVPYTISALMVKNPDCFKNILTVSDLIMKEPLAFGQITPFIGSKSWLSLKLWLHLKALGKSGIGDIMERRYQLA